MRKVRIKLNRFIKCKLTMVLSCGLAFGLSSCRTPDQTLVSADSSAAVPIDEFTTKSYESVLDKHTARANNYSGLYQTFQADLTILSSEMLTALNKKKVEYLQWDEVTLRAEREKSLQEALAYSKFFLRFYTPIREHDDLHKTKSIWKVYLEYGSSRFEGKIRKVHEKMVDVQTLYPHVDRFSTPYEITFNVPMNTIEKGRARVVLTSSLGKAEFSFPTKK